jgi:hypothetical protein
VAGFIKLIAPLPPEPDFRALYTMEHWLVDMSDRVALLDNIVTLLASNAGADLRQGIYHFQLHVTSRKKMGIL